MLFIQANASEIFREEYQALSMSIVRTFVPLCLLTSFSTACDIKGRAVFQISTLWGIRFVVGPAFKGFLAQVAFLFYVGDHSLIFESIVNMLHNHITVILCLTIK